MQLRGQRIRRQPVVYRAAGCDRCTLLVPSERPLGLDLHSDQRICAASVNIFVLVVLAFQRVPALRTLAPKNSEPPFHRPGHHASAFCPSWFVLTPVIAIS